MARSVNLGTLSGQARLEYWSKVGVICIELRGQERAWDEVFDCLADEQVSVFVDKEGRPVRLEIFLSEEQARAFDRLFGRDV